MSHSITSSHCLKLQDGTLANLNRRARRQAPTLIALLRSTVTDRRGNHGKRYSLALILMLILVGLFAGCKDLKDCCLYARLNKRYFAKLLDDPLKHGIPDPTTVSRAIRKLDPDEVVTAGVRFLEAMGIPLGDVYSFDGKTMRAVTGEDAIRHILSLFTHGSHTAIGQIGVSAKENEIPALTRLLQQGQSLNVTTGRLFIGDALHTQKATCKLVLKHQADYLFTVKNNQKKLKRTIAAVIAAADPTAVDTVTHMDTGRGRQITTTVTVLTSNAGEELLPSLKGSEHWPGVVTIGILHRTGTRTGKNGTTHMIDETVGCIASRKLSAEEIAAHLHHHWCIENNLHWTKDEVFGEDKHTLRKENAPQVMTWMRSLAISLCNGLQFRSISDCLHHLAKSPALMWRFLRFAAVV